MKRPTFLAAASILAFAATVFAVPSSAAEQPPPPGRGCIPVGQRCIPFEDIREDTELYVVTNTDGSLRGFQNFSSFASWYWSERQIKVWNIANHLVVDFNRNGAPDEFDEGDNGELDRPAHRAAFATFYSRSDFTGTGFILNPPNIIYDLSNIRHPDGGDWDNRISSVVTTGGASLQSGAGLCSRASCLIPNVYREVFNNSQISFQTDSFFNNRASYVGVFP